MWIVSEGNNIVNTDNGMEILRTGTEASPGIEFKGTSISNWKFKNEKERDVAYMNIAALLGVSGVPTQEILTRYYRKKG